MWIYLITFFASTLCAYIDQKCQKVKVKMRGKSHYTMSIAAWISILVPAFVAGARDYTVGSDTSGYGIIVFNVAMENSFLDFFSSTNMYVKNVEPLYRIFVYGVAKIFGSAFWQFFLIEFIICYLIYRALKEFNSEYAWIGYFIFLTYFYSFSLNLMRQSITLAILVWGFKYVRKKQFVKFLTLVLLSTFIQAMSIVGIFIYPLYYICTGNVSTRIANVNRLFNKHRMLINSLIILASGLVVLETPKLIAIVSSFKGSYGYQMEYMNNTFKPSWTVLILMFFTIFPFLIMFKRGTRKDSDFNFFIIILIMSTVLWQITGISQESYRVMLAFWVLLILAVPKLIEITKYRREMIMYYLVLGIGYFYILFVYDHVNNIYPYTSEMLGVLI